jgi:hypothetical protein
VARSARKVALKALGSGTRFYWTIGLIVTLLGVQNGIMLALFKL